MWVKRGYISEDFVQQEEVFQFGVASKKRTY